MSRLSYKLSNAIARFSAVLLFLAPLAGSVVSAAPAAPAAPPQAALASALDDMLSKVYKPGEPGATLIIVKDGKILARKGYGTADLELGVPVAPDMIFRIGSMTKQFTAVAVLMLMERGQLALQDPITKFLPDYPTQSKTITVEHLLTHTSGIKSYTDLAEWQPLRRKDMTVGEIIGLFKDKPLDFAPGERWRYNNSGYILLGEIIEKVSGQTYEAFLQKNIFDPLGMKHTYYGSASRVIPRRIPGYQAGPSGIENAEYLSMTQPYAAGSLLSNVDDLAAWNEALLAGKLIKRETLERAWTPYKLADGTDARYGFGWVIGEHEGHRLIEHGGGINGFITDGILFPEDRLFVALLANSTLPGRSPAPLCFKAAALALAKPYKEPVAVVLKEKDLAGLPGVYANAWKEEFYVWREGDKFSISGPEIPRTEVFPLSADVFFLKDSMSLIEFKRDARGEPTAVKFIARVGPALTFAKTAKPLPVTRKTFALDPKVFDKYVGEYEIQPTFVITFFRDGGKFMTQATGQPAFEIYPASETVFFLKVVEAEVEFVKDASGTVTGINLNQGGKKIFGKKIR